MGKNRNNFNNEAEVKDDIIEETPAVEEVVTEVPVEAAPVVEEKAPEIPAAEPVKEEPKKVEVAPVAPSPVKKPGIVEVKANRTATL